MINKIIKSYSVSLNTGFPIGNITSQIFANIYLNELDFFIKHKLRIKYYIRYCDDFVILENSKEQLETYIFLINYFLINNLKLCLHSGKIEIRKYNQGIDFLGYVSFPYHRVLRTKTKKRMFKRLEQKIIELRQSKIPKESFKQTFQSYLGVLKHCNSYKLRKEIYDFRFAQNREKDIKALEE